MTYPKAAYTARATKETVTRFAPSPTGRLHLGHAYSALFAAETARAAGGRFLLRIEDIDRTRCRPEFEEAILEDLAWLGLEWEEPVRCQSDHLADYRAALDRLAEISVVYPCFCTRKDIQREITRAGYAPHGREGLVYPGTCRELPESERRARMAAGESHAMRLDVGRAAARCGPLHFEDRSRGRIAVDSLGDGDVVVARLPYQLVDEYVDPELQVSEPVMTYTLHNFTAAPPPAEEFELPAPYTHKTCKRHIGGQPYFHLFSSFLRV